MLWIWKTNLVFSNIFQLPHGKIESRDCHTNNRHTYWIITEWKYIRCGCLVMFFFFETTICTGLLTQDCCNNRSRIWKFLYPLFGKEWRLFVWLWHDESACCRQIVYFVKFSGNFCVECEINYRNVIRNANKTQMFFISSLLLS